MNQTPELTVEMHSGDDRRVHWKGGYKLRHLGKPGIESVPLPPLETFVHEAEIADKTDVVVFGERHGGFAALLRWWGSALDATNHPWLLVHARTPTSGLFRWGAIVPKSSRSIAASVETALTSSDLHERVQALLRVKSPVTLIIRDLAALQGGASAFAGLLVRLRDVNKTLGVVLVSDDEGPLLDSLAASGYLSRSNRYVLPRFGRDEFRALATSYEGSLEDFGEEECSQVLDETGGQPHLAQEILRRASKVADGKPLRDRLGEAATAIKRSPPDVALFWQAALEKALRANRQLVDRFGSYVRGFSLGPSRFPPPKDERGLMIGGWLGLDRLGRWGISSRIHAHLARPVLDRIRGGIS